MAKIKYIGILPKDYKKYGADFGDRIIFGDSVFSNTLQPLPSDDKRRISKLCEFAVKKELKKSGLNSSIASGAGVSAINHSYPATLLDRHTPPLFQSSILTSLRDTIEHTSAISNPIGLFKGYKLVFTVDDTGLSGDLIPPGTNLYVSPAGVFHTVVENGEIEPLIYPSTSTILNGFDGMSTPVMANCPILVGYSLYAARMSATNPNNAQGGATVVTNLCGIKAGNVRHCSIIGQDAIYIYTIQQFNDISGATYSYSASSPNDHALFFAIRKSDGAQFLLTVIAANVCSTVGITSFVSKEVITVEATPKKAILYAVFGKASKTTGTLTINKIIDKVISDLGSFAPATVCAFENKPFSIEPTQWMDCLAPANSDYKKLYFHYISGTNVSTNFSGLGLVKQNKNLTTVPTLTKCTITNLPKEYANADFSQIRQINNISAGCYDITYAAEIYDGSDQYIACWIGITKNPAFIGTTYTDDNIYKQTDSAHYRWFVILRVDPTNDNNLIYQGCISSFKDSKPMYGFVASPDNKQIVAVNEDGVYCYNWSSSAKTFVHVDTIALSRVMSMGMPGKDSSNKQSVWIETLKEAGVFDLCDSDVYQITFGDYINADLRYFDASKGVYVENLALSSLPVSKTGLVYDAKTFTAQCRVKSKIDGVESEFTTGKLVRIRISGVREADGVSIVDCDAGIPWQKTITTTSAWTDITFNYSNPISGLQISAEIIE